MGDKLYREFHGTRPARVRRVRARAIPKKLVKLGRAEAIIYKPERPSKRAGQSYIHHFGDTGTEMLPDKPLLCTDEEGKGLYLIHDQSAFKVTRRGIVG